MVIAAGVITGLMYLALLATAHITPFGDHTWEMYDLKRQYIDFFSCYRRIFSGQEGVLYSFETTLGSGMTGFFIYYLTNPLFLLLLPFPESSLPQGISLVIGITLAAASMVMARFLIWFTEDTGDEARFNPRGFAVLTGAVSWSFSGFFIAHSMNMMWTDVVLLVPAVIYMLETSFFRTSAGKPLKSPIRYTLTISVILVLNYYISYQILLFTVLWVILRMWELKRKKPVRSILEIAACTCAAAGIDAVVLIPTLFELANSPKDIFQLGLKATGKMLSPLHVMSKALFDAYDRTQAISGQPQIYCGLLMLCLTALYFLDEKTDGREKKSRLILMGILMCSFCIDPFNLFWHALMEPSGHPYRQAHLFVFMMVICGTRYLAGIGGSFDRRRSFRYGAVLVIMAAFLFMTRAVRYEYAETKMLVINAVLIALSLSGLFLYETSLTDSGFGGKNRIHGRAFASAMALMLGLMLIVELMRNADFTYNILSENADTAGAFAAEINAVKPVVDRLSETDGDFYRMENLTPRQQNDGMMYGYCGVTHYSSAGMTYVRFLLQKLGFNDDRLLTHYGHDNTVTADMLFGIRYVITKDDTLVHSAYERVQGLPETGVSAYRNPYALPLAVAVSDYDLTGDADVDNPQTIAQDPFALQEDMAGRLAGEKVSIFAEADAESVNCAQNDGPVICVIVTPRIDGEVYMYLDGLMGKVQGLSVYLDDEFLTGYGNYASYKVLNLGYRHAGEHLNVRITSDGDEADFGRPLFVTEDMSAVAAVYGKLKTRETKAWRSGNSQQVRFEIPGDGSGVFTSLPYEEGWSVPGIKVYGALMYFDKETVSKYERSGVLSMHFIPKGMKTGAVISLLSLILLILFHQSRRTG
ncbi:MAG: YfhO family protein [Lachnospiraceae bacterium]|nr:YfhO family protein [Lachnospiraceae bacterium]